MALDYCIETLPTQPEEVVNRILAAWQHNDVGCLKMLRLCGKVKGDTGDIS